eukprot:750350-Prorocentrum_minimum.AAC.2
MVQLLAVRTICSALVRDPEGKGPAEPAAAAGHGGPSDRVRGRRHPRHLRLRRALHPHHRRRRRGGGGAGGPNSAREAGDAEGANGEGRGRRGARAGVTLPKHAESHLESPRLRF